MSAAAVSATHVVVIPSYDTGPIVYATVRAARAAWTPVWVVVDGSRDGTDRGLLAMAADDPGLRVGLLTDVDVLRAAAGLVGRCGAGCHGQHRGRAGHHDGPGGRRDASGTVAEVHGSRPSG